MQHSRTLDRAEIARMLDRLIAGLASLRDEGRFHEPNLDGRPGDYISFDSWEWPQGVGLYGLFRAWEASGRADQLALLEGWYARQLAQPLPALNVNTTAPMLALALLHERSRDPALKRAADAWAERVMAELPRTVEGGFEHLVSDKVNPGELWIDTLFMVVLFLSAHGVATGRPELVAEAERQVLVHLRYLADRDTGLWFHGWTFAGCHNFARARWARGNSWAIAGLLDYLDIAQAGGGVRLFLEGCIRRHAEVLLAHQDASGGWHTLLDDPNSYLEASGSAGIAYGFLRGARLGLLGEAHRAAGLKALGWVAGNIDAAGTLQNVSYGTRMGHDLQFYRDIPCQPTAYGQALALLLMTEAMHHVGA
jgi:unsaturated rhamnogalacturonyl hydrolase